MQYFSTRVKIKTAHIPDHSKCAGCNASKAEAWADLSDDRLRWRYMKVKDHVWCKICHAYISKKAFKKHLENLHDEEFQLLMKRAEKRCEHWWVSTIIQLILFKKRGPLV